MYFNKVLGNLEPPEGIEKIIRRTAARAIIIRNEKILLVHSKKGTYELPGGGVEINESLTDALVQEVVEETGYSHCNVKSEVGIVTEGRLDRFEQIAYFRMVSHYFLCDLINNEKNSEHPEDLEWEPGTTAVWIEPKQAILKNRAALKQNEDFVFIYRENFVLGEVDRIFKLAEG